jgi:hypothetical protein
MFESLLQSTICMCKIEAIIPNASVCQLDYRHLQGTQFMIKLINSLPNSKK